MGWLALEPALVVSSLDRHAAGAGVLVEAVGSEADELALYQRLVLPEGHSSGDERSQDAIEPALQKAGWRLLQPSGRTRRPSRELP